MIILEDVDLHSSRVAHSHHQYGADGLSILDVRFKKVELELLRQKVSEHKASTQQRNLITAMCVLFCLWYLGVKLAKI